MISKHLSFFIKFLYDCGFFYLILEFKEFAITFVSYYGLFKHVIVMFGF